MNSLAESHPELLEEWDYEKNVVSPSEISYGSGKKVWWRCKEGHSWEASLNSRTGMKRGCPFCSGHKTSEKNSMTLKYPGLLEEWDYEKNTIEPEELSHGSKMKVWWRCKEGHSWRATTNLRTNKKTGCPYCAKQRVSNKNSLVVLYPELLKEWDYEKNTIKPEKVSYGSGKKVWWKCKHGHSWEARVVNRVKRKSGCPYCAKQRVSNKNSLVVLYPELLEEWDYEKNALKPEEFSFGSGKKVWWRCKEGHSWEARVSSRTNMKSGCFYCSVKRKKD